MSETGPVGRVTAVLETADYVVLEQPQTIAGVPFDFDALLVGRDSLDLIVVIDLAIESDQPRIVRQLATLARALDVVSSQRPVTVILVGPRPGQSVLRPITEVARVLAIGSPAAGDEGSLRDALAALLPLELAVDATDEDEQSAWDQTQESLRRDHSEEMTPVLAAAGRGKSAVREALCALLAAPLEEIGNEEGAQE